MAPIPLLALTFWCAALCRCDLRSRRLPDALTLPGAAVVLAYGFAAGAPIPALLGAALLTLPYLIVHLARPAALGAGDVKLALGLGAATALGGAPAWTWAALSAPLLTAAAALGTLLAPGRGPRDAGAATLAHGPAMCVASVVALAAGR